MGQRLDLHQILKDILGTDQVFFQGPGKEFMIYPAIVYKRDFGFTEFADNEPHRFEWRYMVTYISNTHDEAGELVLKKIAMLPMCIFDRFYSADNLNHYVYKLFF